MDSELTNIKNELIIYKTTEKLPSEVIKEIQDTLLYGKKIEDFKSLLLRVRHMLGKL